MDVSNYSQSLIISSSIRGSSSLMTAEVRVINWKSTLSSTGVLFGRSSMRQAIKTIRKDKYDNIIQYISSFSFKEIEEAYLLAKSKRKHACHIDYDIERMKGELVSLTAPSDLD